MHASLPVLPEAPSGRSSRGSHQLAAVWTCQQAWYLHYKLGYATVHDKEYRLRGTLIHLALAYHYASLMPSPPAWYYQESLQEALERRGRGFPDGVQRAKEILVAYRDWYVRDPWKPLYIEEEFSASIGELDPNAPVDGLEDERVTCKPDLIVSSPDEDGGASGTSGSVGQVFGEPPLWIVDFKTWRKDWGRNARGLEKWKEDNRFVLDWQVLVNLQIVRRRLPNVRGFIVQRTLREPVNGHYDFDRHVLKIPACAYLEDAPRELRRCVREELRVSTEIASGHRPSKSLWACNGPFGPCDYRPICAARDAEAKADVLQRLYVQER